MQRVDVSDVRRVVTIHDDPIGYFLSRYDDETTPVVASQMRKFFAWLNQRDGWVGVGPKQLLVRQLQAEDPYEIPELIQDFVSSQRNLRKGTLRNRISVILEFFRKNRCPLPEGVNWNWFKVRSTIPPVQGQLTAGVIRNVIGGLPLRWRSLYLVKYQAFLDTKRLWWLNVNGADQITRQLREGRKIIRADLPCGRKKNAGDREGMYFTYFGRDAASDLTRYFNEVRGWPSPGQPIWVYTREDYESGHMSRAKVREIVRPLERAAISVKWVRLMRSLNYIPKETGSTAGPGARYGYNLHEFRDVATTELHVHAKAQGLDMDCVKFWCGQVGQLDPLQYDKFYKNHEYVEQQYAIAEPYLNLLTGTPAEQEVRKITYENEELRQRLATVEGKLGQFETILRSKVVSEQ